MSTLIKTGAGLAAMGGVVVSLVGLMAAAKGDLYLEEHGMECGLGAVFGSMPDECRVALQARKYGPIAAGLGAVVTVVALGVLVVAFLIDSRAGPGGPPATPGETTPFAPKTPEPPDRARPVARTIVLPAMGPPTAGPQPLPPPARRAPRASPYVVAVLGVGALGALGSAVLVVLAARSYDQRGSSTAPAGARSDGDRLPSDPVPSHGDPAPRTEDWIEEGVNPCLGADDEDCYGAAHPFVAAPVELFPATTRASRELMVEGRYPAGNAFDGRMQTAWAVRDAVAGDYVEGCFDELTSIGTVWLTTGYDHRSRRGTDLFTANAHLRDFTVELRDRQRVVERRVLFARSDQRAREIDLLGARGRCVRFVVRTVWPGTRWQDISISEIRIYRHGPDARAARFERCDTSGDGYVDAEEAAVADCEDLEETGVE